MRRACLLQAAILLATMLSAPPLHAGVIAGDQAPNFTKNQLAPGPAVGSALSLSNYAGKVVVLALAGYNCGFCVTNAPSFEANVWQYYLSTNPGEVQVLSADVYNGTPAQLQTFRNQTGATYPLLLAATLSQGGNLYDLYFPDTDDYIVINKQGIVRYHAANLHGHGQRYVLSELRGCIDSLVTNTVGVGDGPRIPAPNLALSPNPFRSRIVVELSNPAGLTSPAFVTVHDLAGRKLATLWSAPLASGSTRFEWAGDVAGTRAPPGVYYIRAKFGGETLVRRAVRVGE